MTYTHTHTQTKKKKNKQIIYAINLNSLILYVREFIYEAIWMKIIFIFVSIWQFKKFIPKFSLEWGLAGLLLLLLTKSCLLQYKTAKFEVAPFFFIKNWIYPKDTNNELCTWGHTSLNMNTHGYCREILKTV